MMMTVVSDHAIASLLTASVAGWLPPALVAAVVALLAIFAVAMFRLFTRPAGTPLMMRVLTLAAAAGAVADLRALENTARPAPTQAILGLACCGLSLWLFLWAERATRNHRLSVAFSPNLPEHLLMAGPYAQMRHPFYAAYVLLWIGAALGTADAVPWGVALLMTALYVAAATVEERKFARTALGASYRAYRDHTGMFWPRLPISIRPGRRRSVVDPL